MVFMYRVIGGQGSVVPRLGTEAVNRRSNMDLTETWGDPP